MAVLNVTKSFVWHAYQRTLSVWQVDNFKPNNLTSLKALLKPTHILYHSEGLRLIKSTVATLIKKHIGTVQTMRFT